MASKRQLKKAIYRSCGEIAGECIYAQEALAPNSNPADWDSIIIDVALLQTEAVNRVSVNYDRTRGEFANAREYRKARAKYFKEVEKALGRYMREQTEQVAAAMNKLMPKKA